nr:uncharacterized protein LOC113823006 isoform X5 [Penaeus vannamei]
MSSCKKRQVLLGFTKKGLAPLYVGVGEREGQRRLSPESDVRVGRQGRSGEVHSQQVASEAKKCLQKSMPHHLRNICPSKNDFMDGKRRKSDGATSGE